jgi:hypothetical protein
MGTQPIHEDNAMSDTDTMVDRLRERLRSLELEAAMVRARVEEVRGLLAVAEGRRRPRRVVPLQHPDLLPPDDEGDVA